MNENNGEGMLQAVDSDYTAFSLSYNCDCVKWTPTPYDWNSWNGEIEIVIYNKTTPGTYDGTSPAQKIMKITYTKSTSSGNSFKLKLEKIDSNSLAAVAGATIKVSSSDTNVEKINGTVGGKLTSASDGKFPEIEVCTKDASGSVTLNITEIQTPAHYEPISDSIQIKVEYSGSTVSSITIVNRSNYNRSR